MKLTDMKMTKTDQKRANTVFAGSSGLEYPWGLSINLDEAAIKKLGLTELPAVGEEVMVHACAKVVRVSASASDKLANRSIELQITDLMLTHGLDADEQSPEAKQRSIAKGYGKAGNVGRKS